MKNFMFDTVIFNRILDGSISIDRFSGNSKYYATHVQEDELNNTSDLNRREKLVHVFNSIVHDQVPTESTVLDVSKLGQSKLGGGGVISPETMLWGVGRWGEGKWGANGGLYEPIRSRLDELKKKENNIQDSLIAETAILNNFCLVTDDVNLLTVTQEFGGSAISFREFFDSNLTLITERRRL